LRLINVHVIVDSPIFAVPVTRAILELPPRIRTLGLFALLQDLLEVSLEGSVVFLGFAGRFCRPRSERLKLGVEGREYRRSRRRPVLY
jgi:hypothetical protein